MAEKNKFILSPTRAFYCLKHFKQLTKDVVEQFVHEGFSEKDIENQLETIGSKFLKKFAQSPFEIYLEIIDRVPSKIIHQENGNVVYSYLFEDFIGIDSLIHVENLSPKEQTNIQKEIRNGFEVQTISSKKANKTKQLNVVFSKSNNEIITIFPGIYAPPFPKDEMDQELKNSSTSFWNNYVMNKDSV